MRLRSSETPFLLSCKNFLEVRLSRSLRLVLLTGDTDYAPVGSLKLFRIYDVLFNRLRFFLSLVLFHFVFSVMFYVCLFLGVFCFRGGVRWMRDVIFLFNSFSGLHQPCLVHLLVLLFHFLPDPRGPGPVLCWFLKRDLWTRMLVWWETHLPDLPPSVLCSPRSPFPSPDPLWVCIPLGSLCDNWSHLHEASTIVSEPSVVTGLELSWFCTANPTFQDSLHPRQLGKVGQPGAEETLLGKRLCGRGRHCVLSHGHLSWFVGKHLPRGAVWFCEIGGA